MLVNLIFLPIPILVEFNLFAKFPHFYRVPAPFMYLMGPIIYLFTRAALNDEKKFYKTDWLHTIPFLLHFTSLVPFYLSSASEKVALINQLDWNGFSIILNSKEGFLNAKAHTILKACSSFIYIFLSLKIVYKYVTIRHYLKNKFVQFVILILTTRILQISFVIYTLVFNNLTYANTLLNLPNSVSLIFIVILLLVQTIRLSGISDDEFSSQFISLTEIDLRDKQIKLKAMDHSSEDMILFLSPNYELLHFNKAAEDYFQLIMDKKLRYNEKLKETLSDPNLSWLNMYSELIIKDHHPISYEIEIVTSKWGGKEWFSINLTPINNDHVEFIGFTVLAKNVSQKKEFESKYLHQIKNLEEIAWRHSHQMRAPLANIIGIANQLLKPLSDTFSDVDRAELLKHLQTEAQKLDLIIRENVQQTVPKK
jgi:PAS domain S-box-containing protein